MVSVKDPVVIILTRKIELVALLLLSFGCLVTVNVLQLFLTVPPVGLQFVIVVFPDHTHLLFYIDKVWVGIVSSNLFLSSIYVSVKKVYGTSRISHDSD